MTELEQIAKTTFTVALSRIVARCTDGGAMKASQDEESICMALKALSEIRPSSPTLREIEQFDEPINRLHFALPLTALD